jgi:hypothetical protein
MKTSSSQLELLQQKMAALEARDKELKTTVTALEAQVTQLRQSHPVAPTNDVDNKLFHSAPTDRRGMMKKIAGLAVGVVTAGLLRPGRTLASVQPVPDTTGSAILMGAFNQPSTSVATVLGNVGTTLASVVFVGANTATSGFTPESFQNIGIVGLASADSSTTPINDMIGLYGLALNTEGPGYGVYGVGPTTGVYGSSDSGAGGVFLGGRAALSLALSEGAVADPNTSEPSASSPGDIYIDSNTGIWYRPETGAANPYRRLADSTTAGALTAFASSSRFVNTITGSGNTYAGEHLNGGATATYQIGGVTVGGNTVPSDARAIIGRIANPNPAGPGGNILVGGTSPPVGGVIAIVAGAPQNSSFISPLDGSGNLYVENTSPSGSTDIIIDIQGYYL